MPGDHINERSCAIRDVVARDLRGASTETTGLFTHVLPQAVLARPRAGITPDVTAPTRVGMPAQAAGAPPQPPRYTMMDVKTLSGANQRAVPRLHEGPHARQRRRGAPVAERARRVNGEYIAKARTLDHEHSRQPAKFAFPRGWYRSAPIPPPPGTRPRAPATGNAAAIDTTLSMSRLERVLPPTVMLQRSAESGATVETLIIHRRTVFGRAPLCDVLIEHPHISARHCM